MIFSTVSASPDGSGSAEMSATWRGTVGAMPRLSARAARASSTAPERPLQLEGGARLVLDGEQELGPRREPLVEAGPDGPFDRRRRFERQPRGGNLLAAGPEREEVPRHVIGDLLVLPVEAPVGAEELLARLLERRVTAAEVEEQPAEGKPGGRRSGPPP